MSAVPMVGSISLRRKNQCGRTQVCVRGAGDARVYLGTYDSEAEARAVGETYLRTGEKPPEGKRGPKTGTKHRPEAVQRRAERLAEQRAAAGGPLPRQRALTVRARPVTQRAERLREKPVARTTDQQSFHEQRIAMMRRIAARMDY